MPSAAVEQRRSEPFLDRTTVSAIDIIPELEGAAQHRLAPLGHRRPNRPTLHADPHRTFALRKAGLAEVLAIVAPVVALHHLAVRFPAIVGNQSRPLKAAVTIDRADGCLSTVVIGHCSVEPVTVKSEEHTSELQSLMRISYAVFCLKKKTNN